MIFCMCSFSSNAFCTRKTKPNVRVNVFAGALDASFTARISPLVNGLRDSGVECEINTPINWKSIAKGKIGYILPVLLTHNPKSYLETLQNPPEVVIINRTATLQMYYLERHFKSRGIKVIFDLDDALFLNNAKIMGLNVRPGSYYLEKMIKNADFVTVNGNCLKKYVDGCNKNACVIPDPIDTVLLSPKHKKNAKKITIGWVGNAMVHHENLGLLVKPLELLSNEYDIRFKIVSYLGDKIVKRLFERLECLMDVDYGLDHWVSFDEYAKLLTDFDILVAPLLKKPWYEGKSSLRVGIGMALGIPIVASPVGEQKYVIRHKVNGFLAQKEAEWYQSLKALIEDSTLRKELGRKGRDMAEKELSLPVCASKLLKVISNSGPLEDSAFSTIY